MIVRAGLLAVAYVVATGTAWAQPADGDRERAAETFRQAEAAFARREYAGAAAGFEEAGRFVPHPKTFLNAAEAWELAGLAARAATACERALGLPDVPSALRDGSTRSCRRSAASRSWVRRARASASTEAAPRPCL